LYWIDEAHHDAFIAGVKKDLSMDAPLYSGAVIEIICPRAPLWRRYPLGSYILAVAAVFGALSAIQDYFGVLFDAPGVEISYSSAGRLDVIENAQISVPLQVTSDVRLAKTQVKFGTVTLRQTSGASAGLAQAPEVNPQVIPSLGPGQEQPITIIGKAPKLATSKELATYELSFAARADAGRFRFAQNISVAPRTIWVWPLNPYTSLQNAARHPPTVCEMDGHIYTSAPAPPGTAIKLEVIMTNRGSSQGPDMVVSPPPGVDQPVTVVPFGSKGLEKAEFRIPAVGNFQTYSYGVFLEFHRQVTDGECKDWFKNVDVSADWGKIDVER
jgi:hypothetical protein